MREKISSIVQELEQREGRQPLLPTETWNPELEARIEALDWQGHHQETVVIALMSGLHLLNDCLYTSHRYAQQIEFDSTGAYWHGLMHRMEEDFSNGKYWFYQAGDHPAMKQAASEISQALQESFDPETAPSGRYRDMLLEFRDNASWHPSTFTDLVVWQRDQDVPQELLELIEQMQVIEKRALLQYTLAACEDIINSL